MGVKKEGSVGSLAAARIRNNDTYYTFREAFSAPLTLPSINNDKNNNDCERVLSLMPLTPIPLYVVCGVYSSDYDFAACQVMFLWFEYCMYIQ